MIEKKLEKFAKLINDISKSLTYKQKELVKVLFEDVLTEITYVEHDKEQLSLEKAGYPEVEYSSLLEKLTIYLDLLGIDKIDVLEADKRFLDFVVSNVNSLKKTPYFEAETLKKTIKFVKRFEQEKNTMPKSVEELAKYKKEIKERNQ